MTKTKSGEKIEDWLIMCDDLGGTPKKEKAKSAILRSYSQLNIEKNNLLDYDKFKIFHISNPIKYIPDILAGIHRLMRIENTSLIDEEDIYGFDYIFENN